MLVGPIFDHAREIVNVKYGVLEGARKLEGASLQKTTMALIPVIVIVTILVFLLLPTVFPPVGCGIGSLCPPPSSTTMPQLMFLDFWDALAAGIGVAIIIYAALNYSKWPRNLRTPIAILLFLAGWFTLLNWVHDGWHRVVGMNLNQIVYIEYVFHVPWLIFSILLVFAVVQFSRSHPSK